MACVLPIARERWFMCKPNIVRSIWLSSSVSYSCTWARFQQIVACQRTESAHRTMRWEGPVSILSCRIKILTLINDHVITRYYQSWAPFNYISPIQFKNWQSYSTTVELRTGRPKLKKYIRLLLSSCTPKFQEAQTFV